MLEIVLLIFLTSSAIGFLTFMTDERHSCMVVLLFPAVKFFAEAGIFI